MTNAVAHPGLEERHIAEVMFHHAPCLLAVLSPAFAFIRVNGRYAQFFGKPAAAFVGRDYAQLFAADPAHAPIIDRLRTALQKGTAQRLDAYSVSQTPEGSLRYWDWHVEPVRDETGAIRFLLLAAVDASETRRLSDELQQSEAFYHALINSMAEGLICTSSSGHIMAVNQSAARILGLAPEQLLGTHLDSKLWQTVREDGTPVTVGDFPAIKALRSGRPQLNEVLGVPCPDGRLAWIAVNSEPIRLPGETQPCAVLNTFHDISHYKAAEASLLRLNRALRLLSNCNQILIHAQDELRLLNDICQLVVETGGYLMCWVGYAEHNAEKTVRPVAGYGAERGYLDAIRISWADDEFGQGPTGISIRTGRTAVNQDYLRNPHMSPWREAARACGYQSSISLPLKHAELTCGALAIYSAASDSFNEAEVRLLEELADNLAFGIYALRAHAERRAAQEELAFLAHHDPLTRLPNRVLLRHRFDAAVSQPAADQTLAMLFIDLDNFKEINDSLGHAIGDELLVHVVKRLQNCLEPEHTLSREGGDEFVVLLPGLAHAEQAAAVAQRMLDCVRHAFEIRAYTLHTSLSIGISVFPQDGRDFETLRKNADIALYQAKDGGRNNYCFFTGQMDVEAHARMQLQINLHDALRNDRFALQFQPQAHIDGRIVGMEALVRWRTADGHCVAPNQFIPVAEQSGLIIPIGKWVLTEACRQAALWHAQGHNWRVAVNLSAVQFKHGDIVATAAEALAAAGLPASALELELTESVLLQDIDATQRTLHALKALGVKLSIDDFGTGYSSLSYLKRLAVDKLKIDRSFVQDLAEDTDNLKIVQAIIQLGHTLKLEVIAEGVETLAQLAYLRDLGCDHIQGYLIGKPLWPEDIPAFLLQGQRLPSER